MRGRAGQVGQDTAGELHFGTESVPSSSKQEGGDNLDLTAATEMNTTNLPV